jgi:hypothetical protein
VKCASNTPLCVLSLVCGGLWIGGDGRWTGGREVDRLRIGIANYASRVPAGMVPRGAPRVVQYNTLCGSTTG